MKKNHIISLALAGMAFVMIADKVLAADTPALPESISVMELNETNEARLFVQDMTLAHMVDTKMLLVDGNSMKVEGMISTAAMGNAIPSHDRKYLYAVTMYYSKLNRGERTDQLEIFDIKTLQRQAEIAIPAKHAQSLPYKGLLSLSENGRYIFVQNATPASSVSVVDVVERKFLAEIPTPGCWSILPSFRNSQVFSTLCGDGTVLTITMEEHAQSLTQKKSKPFFDADADPVFISAANDGEYYYFISYAGAVFKLDLNADNATVKDSWHLLNASDNKKKWRPGGYQLTAIDKQTKKIYVGMHPNAFNGSHKFPATQIWEFDLISHKRLRKLPGNNAIALAVQTKTGTSNNVQAAHMSKLIIINGEASRMEAYSLVGKFRPIIKSMSGLIDTPSTFEVY